jgi:hypothetical protein
MASILEIVSEMNEEYQGLFFKCMKENPTWEGVKMLQATLGAMRVFDSAEYQRLYDIFNTPHGVPVCFVQGENK